MSGWAASRRSGPHALLFIRIGWESAETNKISVMDRSTGLDRWMEEPERSNSLSEMSSFHFCLSNSCSSFKISFEDVFSPLTLLDWTDHEGKIERVREWKTFSWPRSSQTFHLSTVATSFFLLCWVRENLLSWPKSARGYWSSFSYISGKMVCQGDACIKVGIKIIRLFIHY